MIKNDEKPGSYTAVKKGCICPIADNIYGEGREKSDGTLDYFVRGTCPIHGDHKINIVKVKK